MRTYLTILILIITSGFSYSQNYLNSEVIEKSEHYLKEAVGDTLFIYFELDPDSYYEFKTKSGKTKWEHINKGKRTKGIFVNGGDIRFILKHPDFPYLYINKRIYVELDSELNLSEEIILDRIPEFLLKNKPSNWLNDNELDSIISDQNLKKPIEPIRRRLEFNVETKEYFWIVFNTLYKEKCFSDEEILHINPVSGVILKHYEKQYRKMHCYE